MDHLSKTDEIFFARTALDRDRAEAIVRDALAGADDGELFLEMRHSEMLMIDDGRLKSASYNQSSGFGLRAIAGDASAPLPPPPPPPAPLSGAAAQRLPGAPLPPVRIAVARDSAFAFFYHDNLRLLREAGATLLFFSPLSDAALPADTDALYLVGGYPELHAAALAANARMRGAVAAAPMRCVEAVS